MKSSLDHIYKLMQADLQVCQAKMLPVITEIECCFQIASTYCHLITKKATDHQFSTQAEEIYFFKVFKPRFVSEIIFYEFMNHLELFNPESKKNQCNLLLRERTRLEKLVWNNREFYEYYKSGETAKDEIYFVRSTLKSELPLYDYAEGMHSSHDYLIAQIIALERYDRLLEKRLKELNTNIE